MVPQDKTIEIDVNFLYEGMILKSDGYDENGNIVVDRNTPLSKEKIKLIINSGVKTISYTRERLSYKSSDSSRMISEESIQHALQVVDDVEFAIKSNLMKIPVKAAEEIIDRFINDIKNNQEACLNLLDLSEYDDYTYTHSVNVTMLCVYLGFSMTLNEKQIRELGTAALFHDIGKTVIPVEIINKPSALDEQEWEEIKKHPAYGYNILKRGDKISEEVMKGVLFHHENHDGGGYPYGLSGNDIPFYAEAVSVADVFDAMTSERSYKKAHSYSEAFYFILEQSGKKFNARVAQAFLKEIVSKTDAKPLYPIGCYVLLNTGEIAYVVGHSYSPYTLRPVVNIFFKADKQFLKLPQQVDLEHDYNREIKKRIFDQKYIDRFNEFLGRK